MSKLLDMVKDKKVRFCYYRDQALWYQTDDGFMFPVPIKDIGSATFLSEDKAILFMRYIRKHINVLEAEAEEKDENLA